MLRLAGFFVAALVLARLLALLPAIGGMFSGLLGFWIAALILTAVLSRGSAWALARRRVAQARRTLGAVETPANRGKLGSLLLAAGNTRQAVRALEEAAAGEPEVAEWHYRLGQARRAARQPDQALAALERAAEIDEEHAYGAVMLELAAARLRRGEAARSLEAIARFEANHGANPESSCRAGLALKRLGKKDEAAQAFAGAARLYGELPRYRRRGQRRWLARSWLARLL